MDYITLINIETQSIINARNIFNSFEKCSGLKLNLSKTEIILIGSKKGKDIILPTHLCKTVKHRPLKALGVWFYLDSQINLDLNTKECIKYMNTYMNTRE